MHYSLFNLSPLEPKPNPSARKTKRGICKKDHREDPDYEIQTSKSKFHKIIKLLFMDTIIHLFIHAFIPLKVIFFPYSSSSHQVLNITVYLFENPVLVKTD